MLKKLKNEFFLSETDKHLERAKINKTHELVNPKYLNQLSSLISVAKTKNDLLNSLCKKLHSSDNTLKLKVLIALHSIIRKSFDENFCELVMDQQVLAEIGSKQNEGKGSMQSYTRKNIINFYLIYLKKMCIHKDSYLYVKKYAKKQIETELTYRNQLNHEENIEIVTHGFKILNLTNYILQSQQMFNKMGRYHIEHEEILSMYMQLLEDLNLFNSYIKISVRVIMDRNNQSLNSVQDCHKFDFELKLASVRLSVQNPKKDKIGTSSTQAESSSIAFEDDANQFSQEQVEETKHQFLYIYQCQKVSDRLYEYYHNRYYYKLLRNFITFPTFLTIENKEYSRMKNKTKKIDKNLVNLIKKSKFDGESTMICERLRTEPAIKMNQSLTHQKPHYTEMDETTMTKNPYRNISYNILRGKIEETVQEIDDY